MRGDDVVLFFVTSIPSSLTFPDVGVRMVSMISTVVVFAGPVRAQQGRNTSPCLKVNDMSVDRQQIPYRSSFLDFDYVFSAVRMDRRPRFHSAAVLASSSGHGADGGGRFAPRCDSW